MHPFANKITCPDCSGWFGRKIWRCNNKYRPGYHCTTSILTEQRIKDAFVQALTEQVNDNAVLDDAMRLLDGTVYNTTELENWQTEFASQMEEAVALINQLINKNASAAHDPDEYD
ncbi:zinc ribbon domain-containing protein [uncultured Mobiluncus sp.]|uniref:zinc ribbon domain-containing protein n=1 Tax=uncultured Mobiluncus sp. TaxID=293425 RepID=UPI0027D9446C|nr:zinc ribbon domain-containing protein [uncultured Mobiluncus sp.]